MSGRIPRALLAAAILVSAATGAVPDPVVRILETDPPSGTALGVGEPLHVRVVYDSPIPLRFQLQAFEGGSRATRSASFNPAPAYPAGKGEAVGWVAFGNATVVDEIRLEVTDENWQAVTTLVQAVEIDWNDKGSRVRRTPAPWAARLNDAQQQMVSQAGRRAGADDDGLWGLLFMLMGLSVPGYLFLQIWSALRWRNGWRRAALWPLAGMIPVLFYTLFALFAGSNLWPLVLLFVAPAAFLYLAVLGVARRVLSGPGSGLDQGR